jgi:hypothetical protein
LGSRGSDRGTGAAAPSCWTRAAGRSRLPARGGTPRRVRPAPGAAGLHIHKSEEVVMPFGSDAPVEGASGTQARGARVWVTETLGDVLHDISDRELGRLADELLATADRLGGNGNRAADALVGLLWARGTGIGLLDTYPDL